MLEFGATGHSGVKEAQGRPFTAGVVFSVVYLQHCGRHGAQLSGDIRRPFFVSQVVELRVSVSSGMDVPLACISLLVWIRINIHVWKDAWSDGWTHVSI